MKDFHHEFHVSSAGSFCSSSRDLFAQVCRRDDLLGERDTVIFQVNHLQFIANDRIAIDHLTHGADEFDNLLGYMITWSSLEIKFIFL